MVVGVSAALTACGAECGPGTHGRDEVCVADVACGAGTHASNGACVADATCGAGTHAVGAACAPDTTCGPGTRAVGEVCAPDPMAVCGPGTVQMGSQCVLQEPTRTCGEGTVMRGATCVTMSTAVVRLPFRAGEMVRVSQGFYGYFSHNGDSGYSVDFPVPVGTEIRAARDGRVVAVRDDSDRGCAMMSCAADGNYVIVDHGDGTRDRYWHLQQGGARVRVGESVCRGALLGLTGNTGWSTGPHLHLEVTDALGLSLPLSFEEAIGINGGTPVPGRTYTSRNEAPASCTATPAYSTCEPDTFGFLGVRLDAGFPCAAVARDRDYAVSGRTYGATRKVVIGQWRASTQMWQYQCLDAGADGAFRATVSWPSSRYQGHSYFVVTAADEDCNVIGWHSSVDLLLLDP